MNKLFTTQTYKPVHLITVSFNSNIITFESVNATFNSNAGNFNSEQNA